MQKRRLEVAFFYSCPGLKLVADTDVEQIVILAGGCHSIVGIVIVTQECPAGIQIGTYRQIVRIADRNLACVGIVVDFVLLVHEGRHDGIGWRQVDLQADQGISRVERTEAFVNGVGDKGLQQAEVVVAADQRRLGAVGACHVLGVLIGQHRSQRTRCIPDGAGHRATGAGIAGYFAEAIGYLAIDTVFSGKTVVNSIVYAVAAVIEDAYGITGESIGKRIEYGRVGEDHGLDAAQLYFAKVTSQADIGLPVEKPGRITLRTSVCTEACFEYKVGFESVAEIFGAFETDPADALITAIDAN